MNTYTESDFDSLIARFVERKLPKVEWTHEAHLAVAIYFASQFPFEVAMDKVREGIWNHNESVGTANSDTDGYHETITRFWLYKAFEFCKNRPEESLCDRCNAYIMSGNATSKFPLRYYSESLLFSLNARRNWIEPDLLSLADK